MVYCGEGDANCTGCNLTLPIVSTIYITPLPPGTELDCMGTLRMQSNQPLVLLRCKNHIVTELPEYCTHSCDWTGLIRDEDLKVDVKEIPLNFQNHTGYEKCVFILIWIRGKPL